MKRFKLHHLGLYFATLILTVYFTVCNADPSSIPNADKIKNFLAKQDTIRIITDNGANYGDQTASYNLILRLRAMGFKGTFEFIYTTYNADKFIVLFGLPKDTFKNNPNVYEDKKLNVKFISLKYFEELKQAKQIPLVALGMTGASNGGLNYVLKDENSKYADSEGPEHPINYANYLNVSLFLQFEPYTDSPTRVYAEYSYSDTVLWDKNGKMVLPQSRYQFLVIPITNFANLDNLANQYSLPKAFHTLLAKIKNKSINFLPAYGWTLRDDNHYFFPINILEVITGARYAQLNSQASNFHKPLIIAVFDDYHQEIHELKNLIDHNQFGTVSGISTTQANQLKLAGDFFIANLTDANTSKKINSLKQNQILLLSMGPLPKTIFDALYTHTDSNIWPQVREGANSFNTLIFTGKPHVRCREGGDDAWDIGYSLADQAQAQYLKNFYQVFCNWTDKWEQHNVPQIVGQFIMDANDSGKPLLSYFQKLKKEAKNPANDRIASGIEAVIDRSN